MVTIKVIVGSVRPGRFGIQPAEWIMKLSEAYADQAKFELVDLKEVNLPFLDEVNLPAYGNYENDHAKAWSKVISSADGFVFVSSEYNHSYAPALKNAIDFAAKEWFHKPVSFLSYGAGEGGARGVEHLRDVVAWLHMYDLSEHLSLHNYYNNLDEQGKFKFDETHEEKAKAMLDQLVFWAEDMKAARARLAA